MTNKQTENRGEFVVGQTKTTHSMEMPCVETHRERKAESLVALCKRLATCPRNPLSALRHHLFRVFRNPFRRNALTYRLPKVMGVFGCGTAVAVLSGDLWESSTAQC